MSGGYSLVETPVLTKHPLDDFEHVRMPQRSLEERVHLGAVRPWIEAANTGGLSEQIPESQAKTSTVCEWSELTPD